MAVETALLATLLLQNEGYRSPTRWIVALGPMLALTFYFGFQAIPRQPVKRADGGNWTVAVAVAVAALARSMAQ
jgi:hypothetical protein